MKKSNSNLSNFSSQFNQFNQFQPLMYKPRRPAFRADYSKFYSAAKAGILKEVKSIIKEQNIKGFDGALSRALDNNHFKLVDYLLKLGAKIYYSSGYKNLDGYHLFRELDRNNFKALDYIIKNDKIESLESAIDYCYKGRPSYRGPVDENRINSYLIYRAKRETNKDAKSIFIKKLSEYL